MSPARTGSSKETLPLGARSESEPNCAADRALRVLLFDQSGTAVVRGAAVLDLATAGVAVFPIPSNHGPDNRGAPDAA
jgi:hypothetical protein